MELANLALQGWTSRLS